LEEFLPISITVTLSVFAPETREIVPAQMGMNLAFTRVSGVFSSSTCFPYPERFSAPLGARKCLSSEEFLCSKA
jgi:hypothetical protein